VVREQLVARVVASGVGYIVAAPQAETNSLLRFSAGGGYPLALTECFICCTSAEHAGLRCARCRLLRCRSCKAAHLAHVAAVLVVSIHAAPSCFLAGVERTQIENR
jgi:hypothetical protein